MKAFLFICTLAILGWAMMAPNKKMHDQTIYASARHKQKFSFKELERLISDLPRMILNERCSQIEPGENFNAQVWLDSLHCDVFLSETEQKYGNVILTVCEKENVSPVLKNGGVLVVMCAIESNAGRTSNNVLQVEPVTAKEVQVNPDSLKVPYWSFTAGLRYLDLLLKRYGNLPAALVAYNCRPDDFEARFIKAGVNPERGTYWKKYEILAGILNREASVE